MSLSLSLHTMLDGPILWKDFSPVAQGFVDSTLTLVGEGLGLKEEELRKWLSA
jgi:hypothetical protein